MLPMLFKPVSLTGSSRRSSSFAMSLEESALSPYKVTSDDKGELDEVTAYPSLLHLEKMMDGHWWMGIYFSDGMGIHVNFTAKAKIKAQTSAFKGRNSISLGRAVTILKVFEEGQRPTGAAMAVRGLLEERQAAGPSEL
jgi:hypothetical protein